MCKSTDKNVVTRDSKEPDPIFLIGTVMSSLYVAIPSDGGGPGNYLHLDSYRHGEYPSAWSYKATWELCSLASILPSGTM